MEKKILSPVSRREANQHELIMGPNQRGHLEGTIGFVRKKPEYRHFQIMIHDHEKLANIT